jgi:hypothetical protein
MQFSEWGLVLKAAGAAQDIKSDSRTPLPAFFGLFDFPYLRVTT